MRSRRVEHTPKWAPSQLRIDADGHTAPGYACVHQLENGAGTCGGNVFDTEDEIGFHACIVLEPRWRALRRRSDRG